MQPTQMCLFAVQNQQRMALCMGRILNRSNREAHYIKGKDGEKTHQRLKQQGEKYKQSLKCFIF